jgi:hypothetical protein
LQEIETWVAALGRYDNNEFDDALGEFDKIADTSKILFNMGVIHATLGEHEKAVECYQRAVQLDQYFAVAYFQQGVSNFLLGDFEEALANFNDTLLYLRGNSMIDYAQLGLLFKLYSCEVLFNRGLCYIYLQQKEPGMQDLNYAVREKVVEDHNVIDEAIRDEAEGYTVFSIPVGVVYRPNEAKVRNLKTKDYLGKARLVAASDRSNAFTGFAGSEIKNAGSTGRAAEVKDDRPPESISFAASNLVKPGLQSRRQQSEPPVNRNVFPPTPPPEAEKAAMPSRGASVRNGPKPPLAKLSIQTQELSRNKYEKAGSPASAAPRGARSASATPVRGPLSRESPSYGSQRRPSRTIDEEGGYPSDLYDMYQQNSQQSSQRGSRNQGRSRQQPARYVEEDDYSDYDDGSVDEGEFEMVSGRRPPQNASMPRGQSRRAPQIRKMRIKVHATDEVRYIMVGMAVEFPDFVDRIREKFSLRRKFKIKYKDDETDGEMITMGDQDDLDMAMASSQANAKRMRQDTAKLEIWIFET